MGLNMKTRVLFYFDSDSPFYNNLYDSINQAFIDANCITDGATKLLSSEDLNKKILSFKPDFVLEINRSKLEITNFPQNIIHVCWLFDIKAKPASHFFSDILYTFEKNWVKHFKSSARYVTHLPPATDKTIYKPLKLDKKYDFSFLGHIPKPWSIKELNREVGHKKNKLIYFKDILPLLKKHFLSKDITFD